MCALKGTLYAERALSGRVNPRLDCFPYRRKTEVAPVDGATHCSVLDQEDPVGLQLSLGGLFIKYAGSKD